MTLLEPEEVTDTKVVPYATAPEPVPPSVAVRSTADD